MELSREYCMFLQDVLDVNMISKMQKGQDPIKFSTEAGRSGASGGMITQLVDETPALGLSVIQFIRLTMRSPDHETVRACSVCARALIAVATKDPRLSEEVGRELFANLLFALAAGTNANLQADLFAMMRDILWSFGASGLPYEVLASIPGVTPDAIAALQRQLAARRAEKEQRQILRQFVLAAGGDSLQSLTQSSAKREKVAVKLSSRAILGRPHRGDGGGGFGGDGDEAVLPPLF